MSYRIGNKESAQSIADRLNATDPDGGYGVAIHDWNGVDPVTEDRNATLPIWGVTHDHGFIWNAKSLAVWRDEHPITVRVRTMSEYLNA